MSGLTKDQWPVFVNDVYRTCIPGTGWCQLIETSAYLSCDDGTCPEDSPIWEVNFNTILSDFSINVTNTKSLKWRQDLFGNLIILKIMCDRRASWISTSEKSVSNLAAGLEV
jgi:hypothetical protein